MTNLLDQIQEVLLMGPGPSCVHPDVYKALAKPTLGHMDPFFIKIMDELQVSLQKLMNTKNRMTLPISGTGSAGMEACFVNLIERGDQVLILQNGVFGQRMQDVASRLGANVDVLEYKWGTPVVINDVKEKLKLKNYKIVALVHAETSTGVRNPAAEIGKIVKESGALYLLDSVTGLGGIEVRVDDWNVDAFYSGTQKCISCPPGLAPASFSDRAMQVISSRKSKVPNWYLDMDMISKYWGSGERKRVYHHTAPVNMVYALYRALQLIEEEGIENVFKRHRDNHLKLVKGLESLGMKMLVDPPYRLPELNAVIVPDNIDEAKVRSILLNKYHIEIGGGLGSLTGKIWRIGLMGYTSKAENVDRLLNVLGSTMNESKK